MSQPRHCAPRLEGALSFAATSAYIYLFFFVLQPENLLYADKSDDAEIKIADFGLAKLINATEMMETACGTPGYVGEYDGMTVAALHRVFTYRHACSPRSA